MSVHAEWLLKPSEYKAELKALTGKDFLFPPPTNAELKIEYLEVHPGKSMKGKIPYQRRFANPVGLYQGGILAAGIDEIFGPLSYLTAGRPTVTLSLNISYLKAFSEKMGEVIIEGQVLQKTKSFIFMRAEVRSLDGDLIAHAESHVSILRDDQLSKGIS